MDESLEKLAARAEVYRLLSQAYYTPDDSLVDKDFGHPSKEMLRALSLEACARDLENIELSFASGQSTSDLAVEYTRLFRGPVKAAVYPYESMYIDGEVMGKSTLDVVRRYGEAGVGVSEEFKDLPDHISTELEFMRYLCLHELAALQKKDDTEAARFRLMGQSFLTNHPGRWIPQFSSLLLQHATLPFYLGIARITREFISREVAATG